MKEDDIVSSDEESMEDMTDSTYLTKINFNEDTKRKILIISQIINSIIFLILNLFLESDQLSSYFINLEFELIQKSSGLNNTNLNEEVFIIVRSLKNNEGNQQVI